MKPKLKPTNVRFVDRLLGGGTKPVSVNGILSPTGVGKSMLACMIAADSATGGSVFDENITRPAGLWVWFDFHNLGWLCRERVLSHVARISRAQAWQEAPKTEGYESAYMETLPQIDGQVVPATERRQRATECINHQLQLIAQDPDGIPVLELATPAGIAMKLHWLSQQRPIEGVVIDGVPDIWHEFSDATGLSEREFLQRFVEKDCRMMAEHFQCPVWVTHQISGAASGRLPAAAISHRDAADCKTFANSLDACLVMGVASDPDDVFSIRCTKGDPKVVSRERILLKHDNVFSSIVEAKDFVEDRKNKTWKKVPGLKPLLDDSDKNHIEDLLKQVR